MKRIAVGGTTGSGKTTLGLTLAQRMNVPHIELDALHWEPHWTSAAPEVFKQRVCDAIAAESWTSSGNYSIVRDMVWQRADTFIWLDYSFSIVASRLLRRTLRRIVTQEELWSGNRESLRTMLSRDSILLWLLRTYWRRRREYPALLARPQMSHLQVIQFRSPQETTRWLQNTGASGCDKHSEYS
ncbi:MAG TPA: shikimate kinase [Abditibacteriaceae bacterium]|jgi:adenylate kinase family enzyme